MFKSLSEAAGIALSFVALAGTADAGVPLPYSCWPNCNDYLENQQCMAWYGPAWYYCGWSNGITYCCMH